MSQETAGSTPLISVVVPVYNAETYLADTMGNIIYQSVFERFGEDAMEILLVDDCSTDQTPAMLDDLYRQFPARLRVLHLTENHGPGGARNIGMDEARGVYLGFVDSDDLVDVTFYERLLECSGILSPGNPIADYVDSPVYDEAQGQAILVTPPELAGEIDPDHRCLLLCNVGYMYTKLIRRDLLNAHGIRCREHTSSEDEDFLGEVISYAQRVAVYPQPLYLYKKRESSTARRAAQDPMQPFSMLMSCVLSAFGKFTVNPDYQSFLLGAEAFYTNRIVLCLQLFEAYEQARILSPNTLRDTLETLRRTYELTVTVPVEENPYTMGVTPPEDLARLRKYLA